MRFVSLRALLMPVLIGLAAVLPPMVHAGPLSSNFTAFTPNDPATVSLTSGMATIGENQNSSFPSVDISQAFTIPSGAKTLSFHIERLTTDPTASNTLPPFFAADLRDASNVNSLVPAIAGSTDFYTRDLTSPSFTTFSAATGVMVSPADSSTTPIMVTLDISSIPANTSGILVFSVFPNGDFTFTGASVTLTDLALDTGIATTPEPGSIVLLSMGILGLAGYGWRRRAN